MHATVHTSIWSIHPITRLIFRYWKATILKITAIKWCKFDWNSGPCKYSGRRNYVGSAATVKMVTEARKIIVRINPKISGGNDTHLGKSDSLLTLFAFTIAVCQILVLPAHMKYLLRQPAHPFILLLKLPGGLSKWHCLVGQRNLWRCVPNSTLMLTNHEIES